MYLTVYTEKTPRITEKHFNRSVATMAVSRDTKVLRFDILLIKIWAFLS